MISDLLQSPYENLRDSIAAIVSASESSFDKFDALVASSGTIGPIYGAIKAHVEHTIGENLTTDPKSLVQKMPPEIAIFASAIGTYSIVSSVLKSGKPPPPKSPYPAGKYDPYTARLYFGNRLTEVIGRALYITSLSAKYLANIALDAVRYVCLHDSLVAFATILVLIYSITPFNNV